MTIPALPIPDDSVGSATEPTQAPNPATKRVDAVSIDCTLFGFKGGSLDVLLVKHAE